MKSISSFPRPNPSKRHHKYGALSSSEDEFCSENFCDKDEFINSYDSKGLKTRNRWLFVAMLMGIIGIIWSLFLYLTIGSARLENPSCDFVDLGFECFPKISHYWGKYAPYFSVPSKIATEVPDQCHITFAQLLSRHGARDPSLHSSVHYRKLIESIHTNATSYSSSYSFIKDYKYTLGVDQLTRFGEYQMVNSGISFYNRYNKIARSSMPFIRSSGQDRVVNSAINWTQGFEKARLQDVASKDVNKSPYKILIISEEVGSNNTLDHGLCTEFEEGSISKIAHSAVHTWASVFTPNITERLNSNMPGANFTIEETVYIMDLCPFETVADEWGKLSSFCTLFTEKEWLAYDYYYTLEKYYGYSWGNPLGPTQGVGFVNELIARMTGSPVNDHTTTNSTLDSNSSTFPVGGNTILYADFSHDNTMISIFAALGLYNSTRMLSNTTLVDTNESNGYSASWTVPFAARVYLEKMKCVGIDEELVRIIVNDRVIPLSTCDADSLGRCKLNSFIDSLSFSRNGGRWDQC